MNAVEMARQAYAGPSRPVRTPRDIEYDLMARVTHRLKSADIRKKEDFPALAGALHDNNRLWTVLASDASGEGNGLPAKLRSQIVYLCEFTRQHSARVLAGAASAGVLVDINTAILRGLRSDGGEAA